MSNSLFAQMKTFARQGGFNNPNPLQAVGKTWYVDTVRGGGAISNGQRGSAPGAGAFLTMAEAFRVIGNNDTILLSGVVREQLVAPLGVFDVSIIGAANSPRQATSGGVATGGGATWLAPASPTATTPLLELIEQGWLISNIMFGAVTNATTIKLTRAEDAVHPDPSHATIQGCYFQPGAATGAIGIEDSGGVFHCSILDNLFYGLATAIKGIAGAGIAQPSHHLISGNTFTECTNAIDWALAYSTVKDNILNKITTLKINLTGGGDYNHVVDNYLGVAHAAYTIAGGFTSASTHDAWRNYSSDTAAAEVALPA